ncbi:MAG TPA: methyltransferase domain-containing protein [Fimbriimonadaceae bacterium]|nr:methyltransferase domain-containing protein [Fimbriimonadaceae bacterium]
MFRESARFYDAQYGFKDYAGEADVLVTIVTEEVPEARTWLDVACGTGKHLSFLTTRFDVQGVDLNPVLLDAARARLPEVTFHTADMRSFDLGVRFDVVSCLFSAIGSLESVEDLHAAARAFAHHLKPRGLVVVEPWLLPDAFRPGTLHHLTVDEPDLKISRMCLSGLDGRSSVIDFFFQVATPDGIEQFVEPHRLTLFTREEYLDAFAAAGLAVRWIEGGLTGRGLVIGQAP